MLGLVVASIGGVAVVLGDSAPEGERTQAQAPVAVPPADASGQIEATRAASAPASPVATPTAVAAAPQREAAPEPAAPAAKPKTAAKPDGDILIRKCSGSKCHSVSEVSRGGLDTASAVGAIQAMTDNGYLRLTSAERAAVIAALTRK